MEDKAAEGHNPFLVDDIHVDIAVRVDTDGLEGDIHNLLAYLEVVLKLYHGEDHLPLSMPHLKKGPNLLLVVPLVP